MIWFYRIEDTKYFEIFDKDLEEYYTFDETANILGMSKYTLRSILKEEEIEPLRLNYAQIYCLKEDVKKIAERIEESKKSIVLQVKLKIFAVYMFDKLRLFSHQ